MPHYAEWLPTKNKFSTDASASTKNGLLPVQPELINVTYVKGKTAIR
jgi:hypothetical protein